MTPTRTAAALCGAAALCFAHAAAAQSPGAELQRLVAAEVAAHPSLPGEIVHVLAPALGVDTGVAAGVFDRASGKALHPHDGIRVASVTKTFVAAAVLRLHEEGRIHIDTAIGRYLPPDFTARLARDGYAVDAITVRHLLTHTGGIHDYATDERYYAAVLGNPAHRWTRAEQLDSAMAYGDPHFAPGTGYHYSDTGYILLGEILERYTRRPVAQALQLMLNYQRLGLDETYMETMESLPTAARDLSHPYFGDGDTREFDPSFDLYGGGGLVSTAEDLARFYRALLRGEVFRDPATLQTMLAVPPTNERSPGGAYAMGIQRRTIGGVDCWGHTGFWGTSAYHCPGADVTIVRHYNQAQPEEAFVFGRLFDGIARVLGMGQRPAPAHALRKRPSCAGAGNPPVCSSPSHPIRAQEPSVSKETIFREIEVGTGQTLTLGAAIPSDVQSLLSGTPPTYRMNPGTFGRAESITITVNASNGYVQSMTFRYAPGTAYGTLVSEYTEGLGSPASQTGNSATWQDAETTFQLTGNGGSVTSVLTDR